MAEFTFKQEINLYFRICQKITVLHMSLGSVAPAILAVHRFLCRLFLQLSVHSKVSAMKLEEASVGYSIEKSLCNGGRLFIHRSERLEPHIAVRGAVGVCMLYRIFPWF